MKPWKELSMQDKARFIKNNVDIGITSLLDIQNNYSRLKEIEENLPELMNNYDEWKSAVRQIKGIRIDGDPSYDYEGYFNEDPSRAWDLLFDKPNAHFIDTYKTSEHTTFSRESKYSGYKNRFNPEGIRGGRWDENDNFIVSRDQASHENIRRIREEIAREGASSLVINPYNDLQVNKSEVNKYDEGGIKGGNIDYNPQYTTPIESPTMPIDSLKYKNTALNPNVDHSGMKGSKAKPFPEWGLVPDDTKLYISMIPYVGLASDIMDFANEPTLENAIYTVTGGLLDKYRVIKGIPKAVTKTATTMVDFIVNSAQNKANKNKDKD